MTRAPGPITEMFLDMIKEGYVSPTEHMETMRLPGEFISVPSYLTYDTPAPIAASGDDLYAKLGQRS